MAVKRHPALQPLSRDHLIALLHAYRLQQAAAGHERFSLPTCIDGFKEAWRNEIATHFADEERLFVGMNIATPSLTTLFEDHAEVRALVLQLYCDPSSATAAVLGRRLEEHVRWEEHDLFPEIESHWSEQQRVALETATTDIERTRKRSQDGDAD